MDLGRVLPKIEENHSHINKIRHNPCGQIWGCQVCPERTHVSDNAASELASRVGEVAVGFKSWLTKVPDGVKSSTFASNK